MMANQIKLSIKVLPNSGRNEVCGLTNDVWRIKIAAPPEKGKANKELVNYLSKLLGIKKDEITILKGQSSHLKVVAFSGITGDEIKRKLGSGN